MANRTVKEAKNVHGTNPQYLIEKIIRSRIYDSKFWKEQCFALTAELLVDKAMELRFVGGVYGGNIKPTQFLCLTLKMLQIQPEKDIIVEFIKNEEFKYVRALGAFYLRLTGGATDCYKYLEPLYIDNRKLRRQNRSGQFEIVYMDDFIDELLRSDRVCDIILPRLQKRAILEENNELEPKASVLDEDLEDEVVSEDETKEEEKFESHSKSRKSSSPNFMKKKSRRNRSVSRSRTRSRDRDRRDGRARDYYKDLEEFERQRNRARGRDYNNDSEQYERHRNRDSRYERRDRDYERVDFDRGGRSGGSGRYENRDSRSERDREHRRY